MADQTIQRDTGTETIFERGISRTLAVARRWWRIRVVEQIDRPEVIAKRREEAYTSPRYLFMLAMSAGIAMLGLLLSSPAVVIGAMLIAPLMGPIMGAGFALAIGDYKWLRGSARALVWGTLLGAGLCTLIVYISPLQIVTPEIAARTRPNLFDLAIAVFSALAGAYSMIRGREGTIVGVAIATALMPPLAVVGFGIATGNWTVFTGALLLYVTNLMTIALVATIMARIYGFSAALSEKQTNWQTVVIVLVFAALAYPLFISLRQIAWETNAARQISSTVLEGFGPDARLSEIEYDFDADPISVTATVLSPVSRPDAQQDSKRALEELLDRPVTVALTQFRVDTPRDIEAAELLAAQNASDRQRTQQARVVAAQLALAAGVQQGDVVLDRDSSRAVVRARPLPSATLATYRDLETRIGAGAPDWTVQIVPPPLPFPEIEFEDGEPTEAGRDALALVAWAAQRTGFDIALRGGSPETRQVAARLLARSGITPTREVGGPVMNALWASALTSPTETTEE